jgi:methionyl-tRNA formyltransferase
VKIHRTEVRAEEGELGPPGTILRADGEGIEVACGRGRIALMELQLQGKKRLSARDLLAGHPLPPGLRFGGREKETT